MFIHNVLYACIVFSKARSRFAFHKDTFLEESPCTSLIAAEAEFMKRQQDSLAERLIHAGFIPVPWTFHAFLGEKDEGEKKGKMNVFSFKGSL